VLLHSSTAPACATTASSSTFYQDFAASKVDALLNRWSATSTGTTIIAYANGTTATATAPKYTMIGMLLDYSPINLGAPGDASQTQVTFVPVQGATTNLVRGTT
jgi:hypothetical protein